MLEHLSHRSESAAQRVGAWSALAVVVLSVVYVGTGVAWMIFGGDAARRDPGWPLDPYRAILEVIIILIAPAIVILMAALHASSPRDAKAWSLAALAFTVLMAGTTCGLHFVELTVARRIDIARMPALSVMFFSPWPSVLFALDLLAWDFFLGLALLCAAQAFKVGRLQAAIRSGLIVSGALCLAGLLGPLSADLRLQWIAVTGYAFIFPVVCLLLAIHFRRGTK